MSSRSPRVVDTHLIPPVSPDHGILVDNFAGGGGASTAMESAFGRQVDIAINHDPDAIRMHEANHPDTEHYCESVWDVDPAQAARGRHILGAWFSPDCKHFSRAAGGTPKNQKIRGLAWVVLKWASLPDWQRPRLIFLENVAEFLTWRPVTKRGKIDQRYAVGSTFRKFVTQLRALGYTVEWTQLRADNFGAPTIRKRLFLVARCDGHPVRFPHPTHGDPKADPLGVLGLKPWRTAAEIIDWSDLGSSIFERKRPLAENTQRRIAAGIKKFVLDAPEPFIVKPNHGYHYFRGQSVHEPLQTITQCNDKIVVTPVIDRQFGTARGNAVDRPLGAVMCGGAGGKSAVVSPTLIQMGYGERDGQAPRILDLDKPVGTVVSGGNKFAVAAAFMAQHNDGRVGYPIDAPVSTLTARSTQQNPVTLNLAFVAQHNTGVTGRAADAPLSTILSAGCHQQPVTVELAEDSITTDHSEDVSAFLVKFYGNEHGAHSVTEPLGTVTTKDRFGLVTIEGTTYRIIDIRMRMLTPRELFRAQGFPDDYDILEGEMSKVAQVAKAGNAVSPPPAIALIDANVDMYRDAIPAEGEAA